MGVVQERGNCNSSVLAMQKLITMAMKNTTSANEYQYQLIAKA